MTQTEKSSRKVISGVGWVNPLTHDYRVDLAADVHVFSVDASSVETELVQGVDYTVTNVANDAGYAVTITNAGAWGSTAEWVLDARPSIDQGVNLSLGGNFGTPYEQALDKLTRRVQRVYDLAKRAVKVPLETVVGTEYGLPVPAAGKVIGWDTLGAALVNLTLASTVVAMPVTANRYLRNDASGNPAVVSAAQTATLDAVSAVTTAAYGLNFLTYASAADARLAQGVPTFKNLANLLTLDTTKDTVAFCTDISYEGMYLWKSGDQSARTVVQSVTTTSINSGTDVLTKVAHGLITGNGVVPGTAVNGLVLNTCYFVRKIDADTFTLHPTIEDAINNTNKVDLTGTTNLTFKQLVDPLQDVYLIPAGGQLDGTTGAWTRAQGSRSLGIGRERVHRFNDIVHVGLGATGLAKEHSGTTSTTAIGSWIYDDVLSHNYGYLAGAGIVSSPYPQAGFPNAGVAGLVRTPDGASSAQVWGFAGYASGKATSGSSLGWAAYLEAVKWPGSNTTMQVVELDITNANSTPVGSLPTPESSYLQGRTMGLQIGSGGGNSGNVYDADVGLWFFNNGAALRTGIVFLTASLAADAGTGYKHALLLPTKGRIEWFTSDALGNYAYTIHSEVADSTHAIFQIANNAGLQYFNNNGKVTWQQSYVASSVNYISYSPAATGNGPNLQVLGDDTNADLSLIAKGTGGVRLRDGAAANKLVINSTGIGFFNATPVAKATVGAALSTGGAETNTNLATRINELRTALINYGLAS